MAIRQRLTKPSDHSPDEDEWNDEIEQDLSKLNYDTISVSGRDWTVETIFNQVKKGNIDLNPDYQRRNAWDDKKRSAFIESLLIGVPIPQVLLAEPAESKGRFIVIDGKQRISSLVAFLDANLDGVWDKPSLRGLKVRSELNDRTFSELQGSVELRPLVDRFLNRDMRCTIITGVKDDEILYDIFYRLNSGSVGLSTQELRQSLQKGPFTKFLVVATSASGTHLQELLNISAPDRRFRDTELLLRYISFQKYADKYEGNLKKFLDLSLSNINRAWSELEPFVAEKSTQFESTIDRLSKALALPKVGRKFKGGRWETRFNKVLFEAQAFYFSHIPDRSLTQKASQSFLTGFEDLCERNEDFVSSIESTTKTRDNYGVRFSALEKLVNKSFGLNLSINPFR